MTALTTTRAALRRQIGYTLGDVTELVATAAGTTSTFIDTTRVGTNIERAKGRDIVFTSGTNLGLVRRITDSDMTAGVLTFAAVTAATAAADTAEMYNFRLEGWTVPEYNDAINRAIDQAWPLYGTKVTVSAAAVFNGTTTTIDVPSGIDQLESVEFQDTASLWQEIPQADKRFGVGWSVEADGSDVIVRGWNWRNWIDGQSVQLVGYTRSSTLTTDASTTAIPPEWLIAKAASLLLLSATRRDANNYNKGLLYREDAEKLMPSIRVRRRNRPMMVTP